MSPLNSVFKTLWGINMSSFGRFMSSFGTNLITGAVSSATGSRTPNISTVLTGYDNPYQFIGAQTGYSPGWNPLTGRTLDTLGAGGIYGGGGSSMNFSPQSLTSYEDLEYVGNDGIDYSVRAINQLKGDPNKLSSLYLPTYYARLFLSDNFLSPRGCEINIVETGRTSFTWQEIVIEDYIGPDFRTKSTGLRSVTMRVSEALGMTLLDRMANAAMALGVRNFAEALWYLQIKFQGYDPDTGNAMILTEHTKTYALRIIETETQLTATGSVHYIKAIDFGDQASDNKIGLIAENISLEGETVGDILNGVINQMNLDTQKKYGNDLINYRIEFTPYRETLSRSFVAPVDSPGDHKIKPENIKSHTARNRERITISKSMDIGELMEILMASSPTAVQMVGDPAVDGSTKNPPRPSYVFHRVKKTIGANTWDPATNQYYKVITYTIVGYESFSMIDNPDAYNLGGTNGVEQERYERILNSNRLRKVYDYLFTGKNTEVLNFDFKANFHFIIAQNIANGRNDSNHATVGPEYNPNREELVTSPRTPQPNNNAFSATNTQMNNICGKTTEDINVGLSSNDGGAPVPLTVYQIPEGTRKNQNRGVDGRVDTYRSYYSMMLNQWHRDSSFQNIELEIKGDPYWFGTTGVEGNAANGVNAARSTADIADFDNGEHCILLKVEVPAGMNSNLEPIKRINMRFTGLFGVRKVVHTFRDGLFTQTLTGHRIPLWNFDDGTAAAKQRYIGSTSTPATPLPAAPAGNGGSTLLAGNDGTIIG
jgi:hypothetical protein